MPRQKERKIHNILPSRISVKHGLMFYGSSIDIFSYEYRDTRTLDQTFDDVLSACEKVENGNLKNKEKILATLERKLEILERLLLTN